MKKEHIDIDFLLERLQAMITNITTNGNPQVGAVGKGWGSQIFEPPENSVESQPVQSNVEGFDTETQEHSSLFLNAVQASNGGYRFSEALDGKFVGYLPCFVGFARMARKKKVIKISDHFLYNSKSDAFEEARVIAKRQGIGSVCVLTLQSISRGGLWRVHSVESFTV